MVKVVAIKQKATVTTGKLGGVNVEVMLDSGSSVSLVQQNMLSKCQNTVQNNENQPIQLVTASGEQLPIVKHIKAPIQLGEHVFLHDFVVVKKLVAPVILGVDFLHGNGMVLDFS